MESCDALLVVGIVDAVHRVLAQPRPGVVRADRRQARADRPPVPRRRRARRRRAGRRCARCCRTCGATRTARSSRARRRTMRDWWDAHGAARHPRRAPDAPAGASRGIWPRRSPTTRSSAATPGRSPTWVRADDAARPPAVRLLRHELLDGRGLAVRDRRADRLPGPSGRRVHRRRVADRCRWATSPPLVQHDLPVKVIVRQEQHARAHQVGADGVPRQPRVRRGLRAASTS